MPRFVQNQVRQEAEHHPAGEYPASEEVRGQRRATQSIPCIFESSASGSMNSSTRAISSPFELMISTTGRPLTFHFSRIALFAGLSSSSSVRSTWTGTKCFAFERNRLKHEWLREERTADAGLLFYCSNTESRKAFRSYNAACG